MKKSNLIVLVLSASFNATAADVDQGSVSNFGQLDALRSQNAILDAKVKNAELQRKLDQGGGTTIPVQQSVLPVAGQRSTPRTQNTYIDRSARVELVSGIGSNFSAKVVLGDGSSSVVKTGTKLPGLGVVKSISANEVITQMGKETYSIPFAQENPNNFGTASFSPPMPAPVNTVPGVIPMGSN